MVYLSALLVLAWSLTVAVTGTLVAGVTNTDQGQRHLNFCPTTPIIPTHNSCAATGVVYDLYQETAFHGWQGPHDCIGDYCIYSNKDVSKHEWAIFATHAEAGNQLMNQSLLHRLPGSILDGASRWPHREAAIPGKGVGTIATRVIQEDEHIVVEDPIALTHPDVNNLLALPERRQLYDLVLENLPSSARIEFLSLTGDQDPVYIAALNFFTVFGGDRPSQQNPTLYQGAFPTAARLNHDCRPNAAYYFDTKLQLTIRAVRDIEPGEEITLTYTDILQPRAERQRQLRDHWGFECKCKQCSLNDEAIAESDARLVRIIELCGILDNPNVEVIQERILRPETGGELVQLFEEERLDAYMWYALRRATLNYAMFGDGQNARTYGARALKALLREQGREHPDVDDFRVLSTTPSEHWIWAKVTYS